MANDPKVKIEDLPEGTAQGAQEMGEAELDGVVGGIKDGTSNTFLFGNKAVTSLRANPRPRSSDPDSGDEFV
jgi:hypothetical protein